MKKLVPPISHNSPKWFRPYEETHSHSDSRAKRFRLRGTLVPRFFHSAFPLLHPPSLADRKHRSPFVHFVQIGFGHRLSRHLPSLSCVREFRERKDYIPTRCVSAKISQTLPIFTKTNNFLPKYLHISQKSCTFAPSFSRLPRRSADSQPTVNRQSRLTSQLGDAPK